MNENDNDADQVHVCELFTMQFVHLAHTVHIAQTNVVRTVYIQLLQELRSVSATERASLDVRLDGLSKTVAQVHIVISVSYTHLTLPTNREV